MKTKIIYISGAEVFEMADVRAAFEEVRGVLGLGADTILFGVPVDADSALGVPTETQTGGRDVAAPVVDIPAPVVDVIEDAAVVEEFVQDVAQEPAPAIEEEVAAADVEEAPAPKKRGRARKATKAAKIAADEDEAPEPAPVVEVIAPEAPIEHDVAHDADDEDAVEDGDEAAPIPILSILASGVMDEDGVAAEVAEEDTVQEDFETVESDEVAADETQDEFFESVEEVSLAAEDDEVAPDLGDEDDDVAPEVAIDDMIREDAPVAASEKTLEELLETMAPLQEDKVPAPEGMENVEKDAGYPADAFADTDATLEQLAAEFAQNEDKINDATKNAGRGKIGKLKNILPLPFSNKRRDNNGLMGDLFGWAGIAANDDDFAIPGFFTPNSSNNHG